MTEDSGFQNWGGYISGPVSPSACACHQARETDTVEQAVARTGSWCLYVERSSPVPRPLGFPQNRQLLSRGRGGGGGSTDRGFLERREDDPKGKVGSLGHPGRGAPPPPGGPPPPGPPPPPPSTRSSSHLPAGPPSVGSRITPTPPMPLTWLGRPPSPQLQLSPPPHRQPPSAALGGSQDHPPFLFPAGPSEAGRASIFNTFVQKMSLSMKLTTQISGRNGRLAIPGAGKMGFLFGEKSRCRDIKINPDGGKGSF